MGDCIQNSGRVNLKLNKVAKDQRMNVLSRFIPAVLEKHHQNPTLVSTWTDPSQIRLCRLLTNDLVFIQMHWDHSRLPWRCRGAGSEYRSPQCAPSPSAPCRSPRRLTVWAKTACPLPLPSLKMPPQLPFLTRHVNSLLLRNVKPLLLGKPLPSQKLNCILYSTKQQTLQNILYFCSSLWQFRRGRKKEGKREKTRSAKKRKTKAERRRSWEEREVDRHFLDASVWSSWSGRVAVHAN